MTTPSLLRKAFRHWSGTESEERRKLVRNILVNAADSSITSDDVVRLFLQWISIYSELHFSVIKAIYNDKGVTRARIWEKIGKQEVREDCGAPNMDSESATLHKVKKGGANDIHRRQQSPDAQL